MTFPQNFCHFVCYCFSCLEFEWVTLKNSDILALTVGKMSPISEFLSNSFDQRGLMHKLSVPQWTNGFILEFWEVSVIVVKKLWLALKRLISDNVLLYPQFLTLGPPKITVIPMPLNCRMPLSHTSLFHHWLWGHARTRVQIRNWFHKVLPIFVPNQKLKKMLFKKWWKMKI